MKSGVLPHSYIREEGQHQLPRLDLNGQEYQPQTLVFLRTSGPKLRSLGRSGTLHVALRILLANHWLSETV